MNVLNLAAAATDTTIPESTGFTVTVDVIGVLLSLPCWSTFVKGLTHIMKTTMVGQKAYGHTGEWGTRIWTIIREIVGHTKMSKRPGVAAAH